MIQKLISGFVVVEHDQELDEDRQLGGLEHLANEPKLAKVQHEPIL